jgi:hypothetical protein
MLSRLLFAADLLPTVARAQDIHVRVSPDVKTGIESTTEYPLVHQLTRRSEALCSGKVPRRLRPLES